MRARPESTQLEDLSDASFLGKLLVLPANVSLDWKVFARYKHSSLFSLFISNEEKSFITLTPGGGSALVLGGHRPVPGLLPATAATTSQGDAEDHEDNE